LPLLQLPAHPCFGLERQQQGVSAVLQEALLIDKTAHMQCLCIQLSEILLN